MHSAKRFSPPLIEPLRNCPGLEAADAAEGDALVTEAKAKRAIFDTPPTTKAGALALLAFIAEEDDKKAASNAIRNAVMVLERETLS